MPNKKAAKAHERKTKRDARDEAAKRMAADRLERVAAVAYAEREAAGGAAAAAAPAAAASPDADGADAAIAASGVDVVFDGRVFTASRGKPLVVAELHSKVAPLVSSKAEPLDHHGHIWRLNEWWVLVRRGYAPNMLVDGMVLASRPLTALLLEELAGGTSQAALRQVANVAALPGIVGASYAMPDVHSGYGFPIGGVAAMAADDPAAVVSPGGVGFDINCGVRLLRTNLTRADITPHIQERLADALGGDVPAGAGSDGGLRLGKEDLPAILRDGMRAACLRGCQWPDDAAVCEEGGRIDGADLAAVSARAMQRGVQQVGTMGGGNHYVEVQVVESIRDAEAAAAFGLVEGGIVVMVHSGSRGFGHQVCSDFLRAADAAKSRPHVNDRQLAAVTIGSAEGRAYMAAMAAAANFAFANRTVLAHRVRTTFAAIFRSTPERLGMSMVYDVCHNIAKFEDHPAPPPAPPGTHIRCLVHRKGATRALPPGHPLVPAAYRAVGQPVLIGGSMGTASYVLAGAAGSAATFYSTCHGAGRELSRGAALREKRGADVQAEMEAEGILVRAGNPALLAEEAADAYKDVDAVVATCEGAGVTRVVARLKPLVVVKG